ncbi:uncharacterized protein LOC117169510 isoform X4 [Belonocnema kinseyi]|uniref:uncharacterized protein LOC117169510 isoform X4 n=1 Tax=Belonocnema kinseyi TaxID=2817044 RepID=UPI00143D89EB|nr:uncharacterized protein LOC117169510 isoform X4 [Belonocnema kinseyi]
MKILLETVLLPLVVFMNSSDGSDQLPHGDQRAKEWRKRRDFQISDHAAIQGRFGGSAQPIYSDPHADTRGPRARLEHDLSGLPMQTHYRFMPTPPPPPGFINASEDLPKQTTQTPDYVMEPYEHLWFISFFWKFFKVDVDPATKKPFNIELANGNKIEPGHKPDKIIFPDITFYMFRAQPPTLEITGASLYPTIPPPH